MSPTPACTESARTERRSRADTRRLGTAGEFARLAILFVAAIAVTWAAQSIRAAKKKPNLPYATIDHPQFIRASQATFLHSNDLLIGLVDGNLAKAYPAAILAQHGVVQDKLPAGPIAVTWCSYCNTALVFRAAVRGQALLFDTDGVIGSNEVFRDQQTGSRWQQSTFTAISGPLKGTRLEIYPFLLTTWGEWSRLHPGTLVLKPLPGYAERLSTENQIVRQAELGMSGPAPKGSLTHDKRLRPRDTVVGLQTGGQMKAYPSSILQRVHVVNDTVGDTPVLIVRQPASDTTTAFVADAGGRRLEFRAADAQADQLVDRETHSTWNAYGVCVRGRLKGTRLKPLILEPEFWFAWSEFHPKALLYGSRAAR